MGVRIKGWWPGFYVVNSRSLDHRAVSLECILPSDRESRAYSSSYMMQKVDRQVHML